MGLADTLNGIDDLIKGTGAPDWLTGPIRAFNRLNPITGLPSIAADLLNGTALDNARTQVGQLARVPTDLVSALPATWDLIDKAPVVAGAIKGTNDGQPIGLPGADAAGEFAGRVNDFGKGIGETIAGKPLNDSLIHGTDADLAASWSRLVLPSVVAAPAGVRTGIATGLGKLATGVEAVDKVGELAFKGLEVLSPVLLQKPGPIAAGLNVALPGAIGVGLEQLTEPQKEAKLNEEGAKAADVAVQGAQEAAQGAKETKPVAASFSTGDPWADLAVVGVGIATIFAAHKRDVVKRVLGGLQPGDETGLSGVQAFRANVADQAIGIKDPYERMLVELKSPNAQDRSAAFSNVVDSRTGAAIDTKLQGVYQFGEIPESRVKLATPVVDTYNKVKQIDPAKVQVLQDGMLAEFEKATRQRIAEKDKHLTLTTPGHYGTPAAEGEYAAAVARGLDERKTAYHYSDNTGVRVDDADLTKRIAAMRADPQLMDIRNDVRGGMDRMLDYAVEQHAITPGEAAKFRQYNGALYPQELASGASHLMPPAPQAGKGLVVPKNPLEEYPRAIEQIVRRVEFNKTNRTFVNALKNAKAAGSTVADGILGREGKAGGVHSGDRFVYYRDHGGVSKNIEIKDAVVRRAMQNGENRAALHAMSGNLAMAARLFERAATGDIATAIGQPFAPAAALYSAGVGSVMRPKGIAAGWLDKGLQSMTGGKVGVRGDPTLLADMAFRAGQGMIAVAAQRGAAALHKSVITNGKVSQMMTPATADAVGTALSNHYKRSWVYAMQQQGLLGPAVVESINPDQAIKYTQAALLKAQTPVSVGRDALRFVNDIMHAISASPGASVMALNKGKDANLVANAVRNFTGDPGKSGAFAGGFGRGVGKATAATPWGNIFIQSTDRLARELASPKTAPAALVGIVNAVGIPVIAATLWNQSLGPEHSDYQYNVRNADRQANSVYVGLPGVPPEQGLEIPIDPLLRPFKYAVELMVGHQTGVMDGSLFEPDNATHRQAYSEMVHRKWDLSMGDGTVSSSIAMQSILPPVNPLVTAGAALGGIKLRSYGDTSNIYANKKSGFTTSDARDPYREIAGLHESAKTEEVVRSLGANALYLAYNIFMDSNKRFGEGQSTGEVLGNAAQVIGQSSKDSMKAVSGALFSSIAAISPSQEAAGQAVKDKLHGMQALSAAYNATTAKGMPTTGLAGSTRTGFQQLLGGQLSVDPADPRVEQMAQQIGKYYQMLVKEYVQPNAVLYQQRQSMQVSTSHSPAMKRGMMNVIGNQIIENDRDMLTAIQRLEGNMSQAFGVRVQFDKLNLNKGMDQFPAAP